MRGKEVYVPDRIWSDRSICLGARLLWSYLHLTWRQQAAFTYRGVSHTLGISHNSLVKYLSELRHKGLIRFERSSLRTFRCQTLGRGGRSIRLPLDILRDRRLSPAAKFLWGLIRRLKDLFNYTLLTKLTGFSRNSLTKYIQDLQRLGWLCGATSRVARFKHFEPTTANPIALQRQYEIQLLQRRLSLTANRPGNSLGQALAFEAIQLLAAPGTLLCLNAEVNLLHNPETGGLLQVDIYMSDYRLGFEFQGAQHAGPTALFPSHDDFAAQQRRDHLKRVLSQQAGITLHELWAHQLTLPHLSSLLTSAGVPLRTKFDEVEHLLDYLKHSLAGYRKKAQVA